MDPASLRGIVAVAHVVYSFRRRDALSLVLRCFILSVVVLLLGAVGTWQSGLAIWIAAGVAGDISLDLLYSGWKRSWWPLIISGAVTVQLLGIATVAFHRRSQPPSLTLMDLAKALAIPASGVLILVFIGIAVEVIFDPFAWPYPTMPTEGWIYQLMALGAVGYFALAIFGIPYLIIWSLSLRRWKSEHPDDRMSRALFLFYVAFAVIAVAFTALFVISAIRGHNAFL